MAKNPFRRRNTEVERDQAEVEAQGQAEGPSEPAVGNATNNPTEASATASEADPTMDPRAKLGPFSSIGPSELLDKLEASGTGKRKIEAGRDYAKAVPEVRSEELVTIMGNRGLWPSGTVAKATAILEAHPAGDP